MWTFFLKNSSFGYIALKIVKIKMGTIIFAADIHRNLAAGQFYSNFYLVDKDI